MIHLNIDVVRCALAVHFPSLNHGCKGDCCYLDVHRLKIKVETCRLVGSGTGHETAARTMAVMQTLIGAAEKRSRKNIQRPRLTFGQQDLTRASLLHRTAGISRNSHPSAGRSHNLPKTTTKRDPKQGGYRTPKTSLSVGTSRLLTAVGGSKAPTQTAAC